MILMLLAASLSCVTYYSKPFDPPVSEAQRKIFAQARQDVFPDQVREDPDAYVSALVAWAGVVKAAEVVTEGEDSALIIVVAHHYFDWIEDHGPRREIYLLSPRGEGDFVIVKGIASDSLDDWKAEVRNHVGKMLVAVGTPEPPQIATDGSSVIPFADEFYVMFQEKAFRTDWLDYGRELVLMK